MSIPSRFKFYGEFFCKVAAPEGLADLTKKSLPVVPFLFLFYLVLPGYILYLVSAGGIAMVSERLMVAAVMSLPARYRRKQRVCLGLSRKRERYQS